MSPLSASAAAWWRAATAAGPASQLAFTAQPSGSAPGAAFASQPAVAVEDAAGNVVTTDTSAVTVAITSGTGTAGATITCAANSVQASAGIATFSGCSISPAGTGYTLTATDGVLSQAVSSAFDVTAPVVASYQTQISSSGATGAASVYPDGGSVGANGNMYITDSGNSQVVVLPSGTTTPQVLVSPAFGLRDPRGMTLDPDGQHLWVPDTENSRLVEFTLAGGYVRTLGGPKAANGSLKSPYGVVFDTDPANPGIARNAYVADTYGYNVVAFNVTSGNVLWTTSACNNKAFTRTRGIGWGSDGHLYVTDTDNNRIAVLDTTAGTCLGTIGSSGSGPGQIKAPRDVLGDPTGNGIWVADAGNYRIEHLGLWSSTPPSGQYIGASSAGRGSGPGQFIAPQTLFADDGLIAVSDTYNYDIERFTVNADGSPTYLDRVAQGAPPANGGFNGAWSVAYDVQGNLYATDWFNHRVEKFDPQGNFLLQFGSYGSNPGQLEYPRGVAVSADGSRIAVAQENNNISIFNAQGIYVTQIKAAGGFHRPRQVSFDPRDGTLWIADFGHNRVLHLDLAGKILAPTLPTLQMPQGVVVDPSGNVFVSNTGHKTVEEYNGATGALIATLATVGGGAAQVTVPAELALWGSGSREVLLIADSGNNRVLALHTDGTPDPGLTFGTAGSGAGQFNTPNSVAVNPVSGAIAVADFRNSRVSIWTT